MFRPIQSLDQPVTLVGGGEATPGLVNKAFRFAPFLVAADGGARVAQDAGVEIQAVVGDFDSLGSVQLPESKLFHRPDQDATDFQKCLQAVEAPLFLGVGFLGGRVDHQLAAFTALLKEKRPVILLSEQELVFVSPEELTLSLPVGMAFSVYPLLPATITTSGLRYPLTAAQVAPDGLISTSNEVTEPEVSIVSDRRAMLVSLPLQGLGAVLSALAR